MNNGILKLVTLKLSVSIVKSTTFNPSTQKSMEFEGEPVSKTNIENKNKQKNRNTYTTLPN